MHEYDQSQSEALQEPELWYQIDSYVPWVPVGATEGLDLPISIDGTERPNIDFIVVYFGAPTALASSQSVSHAAHTDHRKKDDTPIQQLNPTLSLACRLARWPPT